MNNALPPLPLPPLSHSEGAIFLHNAPPLLAKGKDEWIVTLLFFRKVEIYLRGSSPDLSANGENSERLFSSMSRGCVFKSWNPLVSEKETKTYVGNDYNLLRGLEWWVIICRDFWLKFTAQLLANFSRQMVF